VVFDPIDGSANIDIALTTGSVFGIYGPDEQCLFNIDDDSTVSHLVSHFLAKKNKQQFSKCKPFISVLNSQFKAFANLH
jgi:fructose-1,6-bisphosphatase